MESHQEQRYAWRGSHAVCSETVPSKENMHGLDSISVFLKIVEAGSLAGAARALGLPRSTVGRRLAALEERLGFSLVDRSTSSLRATRAGQRYYDAVAPLLRELHLAGERVAEETLAPSGRVRLGMPVGFGRRLAGVLFQVLHLKFPAIQVELLVTDRELDLIRDDLDILLVQGDLPDSPYFARHLLTLDNVCTASAAYLERHARPERVAELAHHNCLITADGSGQIHTWPLRDGGSIEVAGSIVSTDIDLIYEAVSAGLGLALLPAPLVHADLASGSLVPILPEVGSAERIHALTVDRRPVVRIQAVLDLFAEFIPEGMDMLLNGEKPERFRT